MWRYAIIVAAVWVLPAGGLAAGHITVTGEPQAMAPPTAGPAEGLIDIFFDTADDLPIDLANYQVTVDLSGPNAGTDVRITGFVEPAGLPPTPLFDVAELQFVGPTELSVATLNLGAGVEAPDRSGLLGVTYEVAQDAAPGVYTFGLRDTGPFATFLADSGDSLYDIQTENPTLTIIPEPGTVALMGLGMTVILRRRRRK